MILGCILIKNGEGGKGLESLKAVCDDVFVVEDNTPKPWQVCERDLRQKYIDEAIRIAPDWCVTLDSDEAFSDPVAAREAILATPPAMDTISWVRVDFWGDGRARWRNLYDGSLQFHNRAWRPKEGHFLNSSDMFGGNVPFDNIWSEAVNIVPLSAGAIHHYGMDSVEKREAKKALYKKIDPGARHFGIDFDSYFSDNMVWKYP